MTQTLELRRELYLPRELVFEAWTEPAHLVQWLVPDDGTEARAAVTVTTGGVFDVSWKDPAGARHQQLGRFEQVTAPAGFVCELTCEEGGPVTRLHLELADQVDACQLRLRHHGLPDGDLGCWRERWEARLERLEGYFSAI